MTPSGEILDVQVSQETLDALKSIAGANPLGAMLSKESLINMIKQGTSPMPKDPVKPGATWTNSSATDVPPLGKMISDVKLTYVGPAEVEGKKLERIDMAISMKIEPAAGAAAMVSLKDQNAKGTLYFDTAAGRISHSEIEQNMTMKIAAGPINSDIKTQTKMKVEIKPVGPGS